MPNNQALRGPLVMLAAMLCTLVLAGALAFIAIKLTDGSNARNATSGAAPTPMASTPAETATGESDGCRVAATKWTRLALQHGIETVSAAATAQTMNLDDLGDPTDTITALCSARLAHYVAVANTQLAKANLKISVCSLAGHCDAQASKTIQNITLRAMGAAGRAKQLINQ